jgi:hypothetical protein
MGENAEYCETATSNGLNDGDLRHRQQRTINDPITTHRNKRQEATHRRLRERGEHERGTAHVHKETADPELVRRVRLDHLRARTGNAVRVPLRSGAKGAWRRKGMGHGIHTLSLRESGGRMRVPFFCRTLPMLLPAVPASVSATDSHISPPPAPIRSNPFVRRAPG